LTYEEADGRIAPIRTSEAMPMDTGRWERWAPLSGVAFFALFLGGVGMYVQFPALGDPADDYAAFYVDNRGAILAAVVLLSLALLCFLAFAVSVAARIRAAGEPQLGGIALAGALVWLAVGYVVVGIHASLAFTLAADGDAELVKALSIVASGLDVASSFPLAVFPLAVGLAAVRADVLPRVFALAGLGVPVLALLAGTTWAREGFWSPGGAFGWVATGVFVVWTAATSVLLVVRRRAAELPRPASASM
jgi:hypothetical protein